MPLINPNLGQLIKSFRDDTIEGCILEGSSRSGKTWSGVDFIIWLCSKIETGSTIHILRETYNSFKTSLFEDFARRLPYAGIFDSPFGHVENISRFNLYGSNIHFLSSDKPTKALGAGCDYFWMNEALEISKAVFDQKEQRCRKFWWMDYNPSVTQHWIYDNVLSRPDVSFKRTTFLDNPHVSRKEKKKILSYEPTAVNIKNGTADEYMWDVYGRGVRGALKGQIFKNVEYIDSFPDMAYRYGLDFGFTNDPTALTRFADDSENIFIELLSYEPIDTPDAIDLFLTKIGIEKSLPITADSSDKYTGENKGTVEMVSGLRKKGWRISKVSKTQSLVYWIQEMKKKKIYIVKNHLWQKARVEVNDYTWREINGIQINQPNDSQNHMWDSARYAYMSGHKSRISSGVF